MASNGLGKLCLEIFSFRVSFTSSMVFVVIGADYNRGNFSCVSKTGSFCHDLPDESANLIYTNLTTLERERVKLHNCTTHFSVSFFPFACSSRSAIYIYSFFILKWNRKRGSRNCILRQESAFNSSSFRFRSTHSCAIFVRSKRLLSKAWAWTSNELH
jgi:hypothetical protein